jgi:hypothetical protein
MLFGRRVLAGLCLPLAKSAFRVNLWLADVKLQSHEISVNAFVQCTCSEFRKGRKISRVVAKLVVEQGERQIYVLSLLTETLTALSKVSRLRGESFDELAQIFQSNDEHVGYAGFIL